MFDVRVLRSMFGKAILCFLAAVFSAAAASAQQRTATPAVPAARDLSNYGVRVEPDKRVMIVLATIEAARTTDADGNATRVINTPLSPAGEKFREQLASDMAELNPELRTRITQFLTLYKKRNPNKTDAELVAPFISMAYALTPAPDLADPIVTTDLPGSLLDVLDFAPLVRDFYRRSSFSGNIEEYVKTYRQAADETLRPTAGEMVGELLGYLHTRPELYFTERVKIEAQRSKRTKLQTVETRTRERRFLIVPELLAPVGTVNFLNIKDDYFVIIPPNTDLNFSEARRAYLQFVIDPIILANSKEVATIRDGVRKLLADLRAADANVSPDVYLTISRSLVAAVDARQAEDERVKIATAQAREKILTLKTDDEKRAFAAQLDAFKRTQADETILRLSEDYEKGAVLVFYFADQIKGIEDSQFDIAASMREILLAMDPAKEAGRYASYADARRRAKEARANRGETVAFAVENPVVDGLLKVKDVIDAKQYDRAAADLRNLLAKFPDEPRIHYNLGRVASLQAEQIEDPEKLREKLLEAKVAYENVLRIAEKQPVDRALLSLSCVALGKIFEFYDEDGMAIALYDKAIALSNISGGAYAEAIARKQKLVQQ